MKLLLAAVLALTALSPSAAPTDCAATGGELVWGFKESFRSYISGTIANGEWAVADGASYETPNFRWTGGTGDYEHGSGEVGFTGSITFTGHDGILDTTLVNPRLRFDGYSAVVVLDVVGTTQEGVPVDAHSVDFVRLDLSHAIHADENGTVTVTEAPAVLTADGAAAFGTYLEGEPFDPVSVTFTTAPDCAPIAQPIWLWAAIAALVLALVAAVVVARSRIRVRRSRA